MIAEAMTEFKDFYYSITQKLTYNYCLVWFMHKNKWKAKDK